MAAIDDLMAQIGDPRLRERLAAEWAIASRDKKFGLAFERHLPELLPLPSASPRRGDLVCRRDGVLDEVWWVQAVHDGVATCVRRTSAEEQAGEPDPSAADAVQMLVHELQVVREFGEPIFPALLPVDAVQGGAPDAPWHTLIEADNYHALQLLGYLHAGQVDCIYIDPPYNTGARDWKYNNDYVDANDGWRHSKWLAFMEKRLRLARRLLKPDTGVLIVTIDEHEVHHLGMLLEQEFPDFARQTVTIVINAKGVAQGRFARAEEYALYCFAPGAGTVPHHDDLLNPRSDAVQTPRWERLLRGGTNSRREDRLGLFFPIAVDPTLHKIVAIGDPLPPEEVPDLSDTQNQRTAWPLRTDGSLGNWRVSPPTLRALLEKGYVKLGGFDKARGTWTVLYLGQKARSQIESGAIEIVERDQVTGEVMVRYREAQQRYLKTVWHRPLHDSGIYGSALLKAILGSSASFSFPKSIYSTLDAIAAIVRDRPDALIVDFFAGSGTTLNAVNLLNAVDGGRRRCIVVTNNEVSAEEARALRVRGLQPGDADWEAQGICRSVTWPRSKYTILGRRDDGSELAGEYHTGRSTQRERRRTVRQIGFLEPAQLNTLAKKKELVGLIEGLPQSLVQGECPFIVSEDHSVSILFDPAHAQEWLEALQGQEHISHMYIVVPNKRQFDELKAEVSQLLGPLQVPEDEKRPMGAGFEANLAYFKLDFLDPQRVELRAAFAEILPLLWLKAGSVGPRPAPPAAGAEPALFAPRGSNFVVLLEETRMRQLLEWVQAHAEVAHVFIVTDADEAFKTMAQEVRAAVTPQRASLQVVQLYRDYLRNFMINQNQQDVQMRGTA